MEHQYQPNIDDICREATALEFDVNTDEGLLNITKRGDPSLFYQSFHPYDDPLVLSTAYQWLIEHRAHLDQLDQARRTIQQNPRMSKAENIFPVICLAVVAGVACWFYAWLAQHHQLHPIFAGALITCTVIGWISACYTQLYERYQVRPPMLQLRTNTVGFDPTSREQLAIRLASMPMGTLIGQQMRCRAKSWLAGYGISYSTHGWIKKESKQGEHA